MNPTQESWTCIICGNHHTSLQSPVLREGSLCDRCGATWRNRATVLGLAVALGIDIVPLPHWSADWSRPGLGFGDAPPVFSSIPSKLVYTNTHLDRFPYLDLLDIPASLKGTFSFVLCTDVLEHVPHSIDLAVEGLASLLGENGAAVLSVPLVGATEAREYYPDLVDFEVISQERIRWRKAEGDWEEDDSPEFHGGTGLLLAFRTFSRELFHEQLRRNGFARSIDIPDSYELGVPYLPESGMFVAWR